MPDSCCSCERCKSACIYKPGWFLPGEAEKVAQYLGMSSLEELFRTKLAVDWYEDYFEILPLFWFAADRGGKEWFSSDPVFVLAPATTKSEPGKEYPLDPTGMCRFYDQNTGKCTIYPVRPHECKEYMHDDSPQTRRQRHRAVATAWFNNDQNIIPKLLGRTPVEKKQKKQDV